MTTEMVAAGALAVTTIDELAALQVGAQDVVFVIDVIRAFTTAAILLSRGAADLLCVAEPGEAAPLGAVNSSARLQVGEDVHRPDAEVDIPNSPVAALAADVRGRQLTFFTANGTRGLLQALQHATVVAAALVNAHATARWILTNSRGADVRLVITDPIAPEDRLCAGYLDSLLMQRAVDVRRIRVLALAAAHTHAQFWGVHVTEEYWRSFVADVDVCARVDAFPVVMLGAHDDNGHVLLRRAVSAAVPTEKTVPR